MAETMIPFDAGAGATVTETQWRAMARLWAQTGVASGLAVTAGSGATVNVAAGAAWVDGHYYATDSTKAVTFTTNSTASSVTVYVVLRLDPTANTITPTCITTSPVRNATGVFDLLLYTFVLPPNGTAQTPTSLTDRRYWAGTRVVNESNSQTITGTSGSVTFDLAGQYELPVGVDVALGFDTLYTNAQFTVGNTAQAVLQISYDGGSTWPDSVSTGYSPAMHDYAIQVTGRAGAVIAARSTPTRARFRVTFSAKAAGSNSVTRIDRQLVTLTPIGA